MQEIIRMLRYNTGTDKKAFITFKEYFDAVIFNATIVAYSGSAIADLVSMHKNQYIIDPQTHIIQHDVMAIKTKDKKTGNYVIKKSVKKYFDELPEGVLGIINEDRGLTCSEIRNISNQLVEDVYSFETEYVDSFIKKKEYGKYLEYAGIKAKPRVVIAPYFMLKKGMNDVQRDDFMKLNKDCLEMFIKHNKSKYQYPVAAQIVFDKEVLYENDFLNKVGQVYSVEGYEYVFIWVSDFIPIEATKKDKECFYKLVDLLNKLGKKPVMAYGGYDSVLMCHKQMKARLYGVSQSVGYGEYRPITPVGGGLPVNKYYFGPLHKRIRFDEALDILMRRDYFSDNKTNKAHAEDYYKEICNCDTCKKVIESDIDNFKKYNESNPFLVKGKYGEIKRNRPTTDALLLAAFHFLHRRVIEWASIENEELKTLIERLIINAETYGTKTEIDNAREWCEVFAK